MPIVKVRSYNAVRSELYGEKPKMAQELILQRSYPHTHTEIQFSDRYSEISFSSTLEEPFNGCRFCQIGYSTAYSWDTIPIEVSCDQEDIMYREATELVINNKGYDLFGLLSFATPLSIIHPSMDKYWCSEAVLTVMRSAIIELSLLDILTPEKTHPARADMILRHLYSKECASNNRNIV